MAFGARLRELRESRRVTMKGLARILNLDPSFLSRIERGVVAVPEHVVVQIAKVLGTAEEPLLVRAGHLPKDVENVLHEQPERALAVLRELNRIDERRPSNGAEARAKSQESR